MLDEISPLVKKYYDLFMEAPSGSETFVAYADVLIMLQQSALEEACTQLISRLKKYAEYPFRRKVYKRGLREIASLVSPRNEGKA
jgi:hypothetical protein